MEGNDDKLVIDADLEGAEFSGRNLAAIHVAGAHLKRCSFERMRVEHAFLGSGASTYEDCSFDESSFRILFAGFARFVRCTFRGVKVKEWKGESAELIDCIFTGRITRGIFWGQSPFDPEKRIASDARLRQEFGPKPQTAEFRALVRRRRNEFVGNDFSGADLVDVSFRGGVDLSAQRLPVGGDYLYLSDAPAAIVQVRRDVEKWEDGTRKSAAQSILDVIEETFGTAQRQILVRARNFKSSRKPPGLVDDVFKLLRDQSPVDDLP